MTGHDEPLDLGGPPKGSRRDGTQWPRHRWKARRHKRTRTERCRKYYAEQERERKR